MSRTVRTDVYFYLYSYDESDIIWYSPSSDDKQKQDQNLLNAIEEARRILRRDPSADIEVCGRATDMCGEYEDGNEYDFRVATVSNLDQVEEKVRKEMRK